MRGSRRGGGDRPGAGAAEDSGRLADRSEPIRALVRAVAAEFDVAMGRPDEVKTACGRILDLVRAEAAAERGGDALLAEIGALAPLLRKRSGPIARTLCEFLVHILDILNNPWPTIEAMLDARDPVLARETLAVAFRFAEGGKLSIDDDRIRSFALRVEREGSPFVDRPSLEAVGALLSYRTGAGKRAGRDPLLALFLEEDPSLRRLAARLLDAKGEPPPEEVAAQALGAEAEAALRPYLAYTRAGFLDLLALAPRPGGPVAVLESIRRAERVVGEALLRGVIAEVGWPRLRFGIEATERIGIGVRGSFPLTVSPAEERLFGGAEGTHGVFRLFLFVCHGGDADGPRREEGGEDPVGRFRAYNLAHAEALADILDMAPLTGEKVRRILGRLDRIVGDFTALFERHSDECAILPAVYGELRAKVVAEMEKESESGHLSMELTRLVQMFEDPRSLGEVRTLHGLKRYLHQSGLRLGFRLVETSRATNRTVDLALASPRRVERVVRAIHYVDFEPEEGTGPEAAAAIPYPVRLVADGFGRQLIHGQEKLPGVKIFCYGNEVHYFVAFGNHPAFLRVDYAPPLRGGMIDLEYFGVSKNELEQHPNPSLDGIRLFFRNLEFDVRIENTHIHARYDKERALDLGDVCEKAEALFRLVPYLMEVDWVIGSLALGDDAKRAVAEAWADSFAVWGVLPFHQLLTKDRTGILTGTEPDAAGIREIAWNGEGAYRDRFSAPPPPSLLRALRVSLGDIDEELLPRLETAGARPIGQLLLEEMLLRPLADAARRGELVETPDGYRARGTDLARRVDDAARLAEILERGVDAVRRSAAVALLVAPLERTLRFQTTGSVNGYEVQRARLALRGMSLGLFVLRDAAGVIRLGLFAKDPILSSRREDPSEEWRENARDDSSELAALLRRSSYLAAGPLPLSECPADEAERLAERLCRPNPVRPAPPLPGERLLYGLRASPGRAVGRAVFGTENREPRDLEGAILVAPSIRPEDNTYLYHSAGIVSTGGGVLSHAGLIAVQFRKPSLVVPGRWERAESGELLLHYQTLEYREERQTVGAHDVSVRRSVRERQHLLREGDLVVLDADEGTLRVLGRSPEALALHDGFRLYAEAAAELAGTEDDKSVLALRGRRLRARHQIEKQLRRLSDPVLARYASREILTGTTLAGTGGGGGEKGKLLEILLENPVVSGAARDHLVEIASDLAARLRSLRSEAERRIPEARLPYEVVSVRLRLVRLRETVQGANDSLLACGLEGASREIDDLGAIEELARARLVDLRETLGASIAATARGRVRETGLRHLVRQAERLDLVLSPRREAGGRLEKARRALAAEDEEARECARSKRILRAADGGFELHPFIGWKAANLAELERLGAAGSVPPWFVVADRAFREVLDAPVGAAWAELEIGASQESTLRQLIDGVLARRDLSDREKSARIRSLWSAARIPDDLAAEMIAAYRALAAATDAEDEGGGAEEGPFVAVRSSAREEDAESAARAGEFDTFLFVRGEDALLDHVKRAWSGLWTERAIHNRVVLGQGIGETGGGILVQRIVWSRVSGVLQTVNAAEGELREMVINAGLGLGEGIVSGVVAADQAVVEKEGDFERDPLRFRYITSDKTEQVVFNARAGSGTVRAETLYHQRLRPALEYVELRELVAAASRLETAYGYPLDIEFGIEGARLWILQVRPVATFAAALRETIERYPLAGGTNRPAPPGPKERDS
ncbi:MAG: hypothetical protein EHM19_03530 [Candidatus Latescibacterota bacterium]|nr:MAG: hypothetical protein EHM19_03530 [Candidatus Latescibacterota bacterium]